MTDYLGLSILAIIVLIILGLAYYVLYKQQEPFFAKSMYELLEEEEAEKNRRNLENARSKDVIENNPWIMIEPVTRNATLYPRTLLDSLSGDKPGNIVMHNRSYYDFSDVVYTGLPL